MIGALSLLDLTTQVAAAEVTATPPCKPTPWPLWRRYVEVFVADDGRVIDRSDGDKSTSEGQSYALFFALVANDRQLFDAILRWTNDNLAEGELGAKLPAWRWGKKEDGSWGVQDANAASDADLWMVYSLLEAARLWGEESYAERAEALAASVLREETLDAAGLGKVLLPGPAGFVHQDRLVRLNPSYVPPFLMRRLAQVLGGPWIEIHDTSIRILEEGAPLGRVPDWIAWDLEERRFRPDPQHGSLGSYDAIRAYLWPALLPKGSLLRDRLLAASRGLLHAYRTTGTVAETFDTLSMKAGKGNAPPGFVGITRLRARDAGDEALEQVLAQRLADAEMEGLYGAPPAYYDQNLLLFAQGHLEGRYAFAVDGRLLPRWETSCR